METLLGLTYQQARFLSEWSGLPLNWDEAFKSALGHSSEAYGRSLMRIAEMLDLWASVGGRIPIDEAAQLFPPPRPPKRHINVPNPRWTRPLNEGDKRT